MLQVATRRIMLVSAALLYIFAISLNIITINIQKASADALIAYGGSDVSGVVEEEISLTGISVSGSDPTIPMVIDISDSNGILYMTDTTGISFDGSDRGSRLSFSGSVSDINNALATLKYRTLNSGTWTLTATLLGAGVVFFPGNGHLYEVVNNGSAISWDDAAPLAAARTLNGATGYLATVTEQAENDYLLGKLTGDGWFGASDAATEGDWQWVSGPETGTSFWAGLGDGAPVSSLFSNWADGEPNDSGGEDCAQFYSDGSGWNDLPCDGAFFSNYIVEYGGPSDIPIAPESVDFEVTVTEPTSTTVPISSCLDLIDVYNNGADNRYDTLNVTADIDCDGESLSPMFDQTDPDFGIVGFRGTFNGNNHTISNVVMSNSVQSDFGLFSVANDATFQDVTIGGSFEGDACTGSLVGRAINSSFQNITVGADVTGTNGTGGVVGCIEGRGDVESTLADSATVSTVTGSDRVGGLVGTADLEDESVFGLTGNDFSGTLNSSGWAIGGILGSTEQSETAQFNVSANTTAEINIPSAYTVGGTIGYVYLEENSGINFDDNQVTGLIYGDDTVGGFIGELTNDGDIDNSIVTNVSNNSAVTSGDGDNVGGIIGYASYSKLTNVSSSGNITGADDETGGLVGEAYNLEITESYSTSTVLGYDSLVGGLVGRNSETTIERSYSTGDVSGEDRIGGLVGANGGYIIDSYARGDISATDGEVGGLAGRCGRDITRSYATGEVSGSYDVGGLLGYSDGCDVVDSFWDADTSLQATSSGDETSKTTAEMKEKDTFTDTATLGLDTAWDFSTVWAINTLVNDNYPCLQWQDENCEINTDNDGISKEEEAAAPNGGDANNDGTIDSVQNFVSSFVNPVSSKYTVVETDAVCDLNAVSADTEANKSVQDSGYAYSTGLVNFTADCGTPGYTTTVRLIFFDKLSSGLVLRKFNPTTNAYFTINNATVTDSVIGGRPALVVTYQIVDGGELDTDGVINGVIVDPVGLASLVVGVPNTGFQR